MQLEHEPVEALPGEETALGGIQAVAFSEEGDLLISCCRDMRARPRTFTGSLYFPHPNI